MHLVVVSAKEGGIGSEWGHLYSKVPGRTWHAGSSHTGIHFHSHPHIGHITDNTRRMTSEYQVLRHWSAVCGLQSEEGSSHAATAFKKPLEESICRFITALRGVAWSDKADLRGSRGGLLPSHTACIGFRWTNKHLIIYFYAKKLEVLRVTGAIPDHYWNLIAWGNEEQCSTWSLLGFFFYYYLFIYKKPGDCLVWHVQENNTQYLTGANQSTRD